LEDIRAPVRKGADRDNNVVVKFYFAYGSNMSRTRIESRIGEIEHHGWATLPDFVHSFSHRGSDGTAKGNVHPRPGEVVHGVLYRLSPEQVEGLHAFEGGYDPVVVEVQRQQDDERIEAYTYLSQRFDPTLVPSAEYLAHYLQGLEENFIPDSYVELIRSQALGKKP
jgi:cation transport regulator ChaC